MTDKANYRNELYNKVKKGELEIDELSDDDLNKAIRASAYMGLSPETSAQAFAKILLNEQVNRRSKYENESRAKSECAMRWLTGALVLVGVVQIIVAAINGSK